MTKLCQKVQSSQVNFMDGIFCHSVYCNRQAIDIVVDMVIIFSLMFFVIFLTI